MSEKLEKLRKIIAEEAAASCWEIDDDHIVDDFAGGNIDDAFDGGTRTGRRDLAAELLAVLDEP